MKYSDIGFNSNGSNNNSYGSSFKFDPNNYDDLENSIVDSLSEISIASNLPLNVQNQDLLNRTINEIFSLYLWSTDFNTTSLPNNLASSVSSSSSSSYNAPNDDFSNKRIKNSKPRLPGDIDSNHRIINAWESEKPQQQRKDLDSSKNIQNIKKLNKEFLNSFEEDYNNESNKSPKKSSQKNYLQDANNSVTTEKSNNNNSNKQSHFLSSTSDITPNSKNSSSLINNHPNLNTSDFINPKFVDDSLDSNNKNSKQRLSNDGKITNPISNNFSIKSNSNDNNLKRRNDSNHTTQITQQSHIKYEIENLLRELKLFKNPNSDYNEYYDQENENKLLKSENEKLNSMAVTLKELLTRLLEKRKASKRNMNIDKMTREEIQAEKIETQKELLSFEDRFGRPQTKLEKDLMRPLYDHYRKVKRILSKVTSTGSSSTNGKDQDMDDHHASHNHTPPNHQYLENENSDEIIRDHKHFINLHSLNLSELLKEKDSASQEKLKLKELIKKYEIDIVNLNGNLKLSANSANKSGHKNSDDRELHKEDIEKYKILKAKLKLIDALIEKHEHSSKNK